jgi:hypothetical protein
MFLQTTTPGYSSETSAQELQQHQHQYKKKAQCGTLRHSGKIARNSGSIHVKRVLGKKKTQHKEWISSNTIKRIEKRKEKKGILIISRTRAAKVKAQEEYTAADREVKKSVKKDKKDYIKELASHAKNAARQGNLKDLYLITKKLAGKFQQTDKSVKDKDGNPLTSTDKQLKRWAEHFMELLFHPTPETPLDTYHQQRQSY